MYFNECARFAADEPDLREVIERLDAQLARLGSGVLRPADLADVVGETPYRVGAVLDGLAGTGLLRREEMLECPSCQTLTPLATHRQRIDGDDESRCSSCDADLTGSRVQRRAVYRTTWDAPKVLPRPVRPQTPGAATLPSVLFIAGDRGGPQQQQLQLPNEYHAIEGALRTEPCVLRLAGPILGATRSRLADAYRARPRILHFAGHGDDRKLTILDDRGAIVREVPLDVSQLADLLRTLADTLRLCVLNTCKSAPLARELVAGGLVAHAIGWDVGVADTAAIAFSVALYGALGTRTLTEAVQIGRVAAGLANALILVTRAGDSDAERFSTGGTA